MTEIIIQTRIRQKEPTGNTVSRSRLTEMINENIQKKLVLICCPAGYGKTTLVQDYLKMFKKDAAWFQVTEDVSNFYSFITYIVHSLKILRSGFGKRVLDVIQSLKETMTFSKDSQLIVTTVIGTLSNEFIEYFEGEALLVIDDLHRLENPDWINLTFDILFENLPENLHLIIVSRERPKFDMTKLKSKRDFFELSAKDLIFDVSEIEKLLNEVYSINHSANDVVIIQDRLKGWITGIHLVLQVFGNDLKSADFEKDELPENLFNFFANDIFGKLGGEAQEFLLKTALVDNFSMDVCTNALGIKNSGKILSELINKNIFVETSNLQNSTDGDGLSYNYHALFKQYLVAKLRENKTEGEIYKITDSIAKYYENNNDPANAVNYLLISKNFKRILDLIPQVYPILFEQGRFERIWNWFQSIPEEMITENARMLYYKGQILKYYKGDRDISIKYYIRALTSPGIESDSDLYLNCLMEQAECLTSLGKPDESVEILTRTMKQDASPLNKVKLLFFLAGSFYRIGYSKYDEIIKVLNEGIDICKDNDIKNIPTEMHNLLGNVYQDRGEFIRALYYFEIAERNETNVYKRIRTLTNIVLLYSYSGNFVKAKEFLDRAEELYELYPSRMFERFLLRADASFRFECCDYEESIRKFERLTELDLSNHLDFFVWGYYLFIGESQYLLKNYDKARQYFDLASNYTLENDEYQLLENKLHKTLLRKQKELTSEIEDTLLEALKYYEDNNIVYSKSQVEFHLADFYFRRREFSTSLKFLDSSLSTASEKQYISFLEQLFINFRYLFDFAIANNLHKDFIHTIYSGLQNKSGYTWLSAECRDRLAKEMEQLCDLKLISFGKAEIYLRGDLIPEKAWVRKKSKQVLIFLLLNPKVNFSKEKLMDIFFPEHSPESAENLFHQIINNIRNVTIINYENFENHAKSSSGKRDSAGKKRKGNDSKNYPVSPDTSPPMIFYEDHVLRLNRSNNYRIDALEFDALYKTFKSSETSDEVKIESAEKAIEIYKGDFLSGYYESWSEELRENYISKMTGICDDFIKILKRRKQYEKIITPCEKLLQLNNTNEDAYLELIRAHTYLGDKELAKKVFSNMLKVFKKEFGEDPSDELLGKINNMLQN